MAKGSNDLNMLLKAKVVKLKAELDVKGSMPTINKQVDEITKKLKDKSVKLKVELSVSMADLNKQLGLINTALKNSKSFKPLKIGVEIDVQGSAKQIKDQLKEVYETVEDFNKKYGQQLKQMQELQQKTQSKSKPKTSATNPLNIPTDSNIGGFDSKAYAKQLKDAEQMMKSTFGKGLFSSFEMKDATGNLTGFIAQLDKVNGVVQKIQYQWNAEADAFTPINQQTVTNTEKHVDKAIKSLRELDREIMRVTNKDTKSSFWQDYNDLEFRGQRGTLTQDMVNDLKRRVKDEQSLSQIIKKENDDLLVQKKLIYEIKKARDKDWTKNQDVDRRKEYNNLISNALTNPNEGKSYILELQKINDEANKKNQIDKEYIENTKKRMSVLQELRKLQNSTVSSDKTSQTLIRDAKALAQRAKAGKEWLEVSKKINSIKNSNQNDAMIEKSVDIRFKIEQKMRELVDLGRMTSSQFDEALKQLPITAQRNFADLERQYAHLNRKVKEVNAEMKREANQTKVILAPDAPQADGFKKAVDSGNISEIQHYVGELYKGKVETVDFKDTTDKLGRAVTELQVKMKGTGKTIQTYTLQMEKADGTLRETAKGVSYNANRNLGVFEQLRIAMARVPVWMTAMTAFYGTIHSVQAMSREILAVDKSLTELKRVASDSLSIDSLFGGAVKMSGELGNNIHDIMQSLNDFARTFGDFNERQLLAITNTATLMSNVSDLSAQEATESLVGTMNAFNVEAEESIRIVDAMNEVDNNYAVSTKQLAQGLSKSASTARTFGVAMEENLGHITAISSVTMESGNVIGNSLKTIYSRMTTLNNSISVLEGVGVAVHDLEGDVRPVNDILGDLSKRWGILSKSQQQNIAVQVAGRYQLSRFLALMNNYDIALNATNTAVYSHGSAIRENAEYMKSYEARINKLKNGFTELSLAVGEAFLSGGMLAVIEGLGSLAKLGVTVTNTFGALPPVMLAVFLILNKMNVFDKLKDTISGAIMTAKQFGQEYKNNVGGTTQTTRLGALRGAWNSVTVAEAGATAGAKSFGIALKGALISTGIGIAIVALGFAIEKLIGHYQKHKQKAEELEKLNNSMVKSFRSSGDGLKGLTERYIELSKMQIKTTEEQEEFNRVQADLSKAMPTVVAFVDSNGKAHFRSAEAIRFEREQLEKLSKEKAKLNDLNYEENMKKQSESYAKILKNINKLEKDRQTLIDTDKTVSTTYDSINHQTVTEVLDNTEEIQKSNIEIIMQEAEKTEAIKSTIRAIQTQTLSYLEANGKMEGLGDSQIKVIENFVQQNDAYLRGAGNNIDEYNKRVAELYVLGTKVGETLNTVFVNMTMGIKNPLKIDEIKKELNTLAKILPDEFFKVDENRNTRIIIDDLNEINAITRMVENGSGTWDDLTNKLMNAGLSYDNARGFLARLAREHDNTALRQEAMRLGIEELEGSIENLNQDVLQSVDLTATLFGYNSSDLSAMKSHIQNMNLLADAHGEAGKQSLAYRDSVSALTDYLKITESELEANKDNYFAIIDALMQVDLSTYDAVDSFDAFVNAQENLSKSQKEMLIEWGKTDGAKDVLTGANKDVADSYKEVTKAVNDARDASGKKIPMGLQKAENINIATPNLTKEMQDGIKTASDLAVEVAKTQEALGETGKSFIDMKKKAGETVTDVNKGFGEIAKQTETNSRRVVTAIEKITEAYKKMVNVANNSTSGGGSSTVTSGAFRARGGGDYTGDASSNFSSLSGEGASSSGGGDTGTSGVMIGSYNLEGGYDFHALAVKNIYTKYGEEYLKNGGKTPSKTTTSIDRADRDEQRKEDLADLYIWNELEKKADALSSAISLLDARMSSMDKNTAKYRNTLKSVIALSNNQLAVNQKDLKAMEARNKAIQRTVKSYGDVKTHTKTERDNYNKLMQEYDSNLSKINSLKLQIENMTVDIKNKSVEIFSDFIGEIVGKYDKAINRIESRIDNLDFGIELLEITDPENTQAIIDKQSEKAKELRGQRNQSQSKVAKLKAEKDMAVKKYGSNSKQALFAKEELEKAEEEYEDYVLAVARAEKSVRDTRKEIADEILRKEQEILNKRTEVADRAIEALKNYYQNMKDMATEAVESEKRVLEKSHNSRMKYYDDEIAKINAVYDNKFSKMDEDKSKKEYEDELTEKNANKAELVNKISLLSRDNTLDGKKRFAELQKELEEADKDISQYMKARQEEELRTQMEKQKEAQIREIEGGFDEHNRYIEGKREIEERAYEQRIESLDEERNRIAKHYDSILNNERAWATKREEFMKGNFSSLQTELDSMYLSLDEMNKGVFDGLTESFSKFAEEVKRQTREINKLNIDNMMFGSEGVQSSIGGLTGSSSNSKPIQTSNKGRLTTGSFQKRETADMINSMMTKNYQSSSSKVVSDGNGGYKVIGDFSSVDRAEKVLADLKLKKLLSIGHISRFKTGGYTGDWSGGGGKIGILDSKEIVLDEKDTSNLLDTVKLVDKIKNFLPNLMQNNFKDQLASAGGLNIENNYNVNLYIDNLNGDKNGANLVVTEILKGLKKRGK